MSQAATDAAVADLVEVRHNLTFSTNHPQAEIADPSSTDDAKPTSGATGQRPTRKVVDPPGGKQNLRLFGEEYEEEDALSLAPPPNSGSGVDVDVDRMQHLKLHVEREADGTAEITDVKESNDAPTSSSDAASGDRVSNPPSNFRPTRKVRQGEFTRVMGRRDRMLTLV